MGLGVVFIFTILFGGIGFALPVALPDSPHKELIKLMVTMSTICCYLMWLVTYISQMNPLFGPIINNATLALMRREW